MKTENAENLIKQVQNVNEEVNNMIIPILKDTISDYKSTFRKMFIIIILLIVGLISMFIYAQYNNNKQVQKYNDFLSQFEFEGEDSSIYQDVDSGDGR